MLKLACHISQYGIFLGYLWNSQGNLACHNPSSGSDGMRLFIYAEVSRV
jgi:hypothetical protein